MKFKVLITGAEGMLGTEVLSTFKNAGYSVYGFNSQEFDITNFESGIEIAKNIEPQVIINCAAYTDVDGAEENQEKALNVNALGVRNLSLIAKELDAKLLHFSTDFIFDGKKVEPYHIFDDPNPINFYGLTKYMGEQYISSLCPKFFIIRTSWLFGGNGKSFVKSILSAAKTNDYLTVVDDQIGSPTYTKDLASAVLKIVDTPYLGIYHITNQGSTSWFEFAKKICQKSGINIDIRPIKSKDLKRAAKRPLNSRLDHFPLEESIGELLPPWEDGLKRFLVENEPGGAI